MNIKRVNKIPKSKILLGPPFITRDDEKAVIKVLRSGQLSLGPVLTKFEENFARWVGSKYAVATSSGSTALHLCIRAIGIKENDEIITSPYSFVASANCILYEKAKPVFVDIDPVGLTIDPDKIEKAITKKTKAILPVHIFGLPADLDKIYKIAKKYKLSVIEDAAESVGATCKSKKIGSFGNLTVFAFYPNKQMTTGEGGMITTNDKTLYRYIKGLVNQGRKLGDSWLEHYYLGYNYRMDEMSAALGLSQLKKLDIFLQNRKSVASHYKKFLTNISGVELLHDNFENITRSWFVYIIRLNKMINRSQLIQKLEKKGIPTRPYLPSIHLQPYFRKQFGYKKGDYPVCEEISLQTLALPFYTGMTKAQVKYICQTLSDVLQSLP